MLSAFVLIKLKIKQSLALSRRYNSPFFHLQPCWVSLTHTPIMKASRHPRGSLVSRSCHWVYHTPTDSTHHHLHPPAVFWEPPNLPYPLPLK